MLRALRSLYVTTALIILTLAIVSVCHAQTFDPTLSNGAGCVSNGSPTYCNQSFAALSTDPTFTNAQTQVVDPAAAPYTGSSLSSYLYSGATTRFLMHYQPWFCNTGTPPTTCNGHIIVGYNENVSGTVAGQLAAMNALGVDVVVPDWYGNSASKLFNRTTVETMAALIAGSPSTYPKLLLGMDQGAWSNSGQCPAGSGITTAQMEACIDEQLDYAAVNYLYQSYYETFGGKPIVTFFLDESGWSSVDWDAVWVHEHAHVAAGQHCTTSGLTCTYTSQVLLLGRNSASITRTGLDGSFAWPPASAYVNGSPSSQFLWNGAAGYLDNFYTICRANPSKLCIGGLWKGFDDSNASFGTNKVMAQQCGQVPILTANKIGSLGYSSSSQLAYAQIATWNDYEEGTEIETGIDNCSSSTISILGTTLTYNLSFSDVTYGTLSTIDHFQILYCSSSTSCQVAPSLGSIAPGSSGVASLLSVPQGSWTIKLQSVGKPMIRSVLSNGIAFVSSPATGITFSGGVKFSSGTKVQ